MGKSTYVKPACPTAIPTNKYFWKNYVGDKKPCKSCPGAHLGETRESIHTHEKSHFIKFNSKSQHIMEGSAHLKQNLMFPKGWRKFLRTF